MIKKFFRAIINFIAKWGVYGILAVITLYIPLWLGYVLQDQGMINFGWIWAGIWAAPIFTPAWLVLIILAALYKWIWKVVILRSIFWAKELAIKVQLQNQLSLYYDSDEIQMLLDHGKELKKYSDEKKKEFFTNLKKERIEMIDRK